MVLDMGDEEGDTPIILGRLFLNTTDARKNIPQENKNILDCSVFQLLKTQVKVEKLHSYK
jgi:hypothetical protein